MTINPPRNLSSRSNNRINPFSEWNFSEWFILLQTIIPGLLYLPGTQPFRVPIRLASYGIPLLALFYFCFIVNSSVRSRLVRNPSIFWVIISMIVLGLELLHPLTQLLAGLAQVGLYLAILSPLFWSGIFVTDPERLNRLLLLALLCFGINAFVGVMQVHDPARWMPRDFSSIITSSDYGLTPLSYEGNAGRTIIRPPGLGDAPGAVCGPAALALFLGLVFATSKWSWWRTPLSIIISGLGAAAIFFSLVRSSFLIAGAMLVAYAAVFVLRGRPARALILVSLTILVISYAFISSIATGGDSVLDRFTTLIEDNPGDLYYNSRGNQIEDAFTNILPKYPLGAGLGRWGMMNVYFGNQFSQVPIWVEIQIPAWIVDGGVILLITYPLAVLAALLYQFRVATAHPDEAIKDIATIVFSLNIGIATLIFSYPVFLSPLGILFWFFTGSLYSAIGPMTTSSLRLRKRRYLTR